MYGKIERNSFGKTVDRKTGVLRLRKEILRLVFGLEVPEYFSFRYIFNLCFNSEWSDRSIMKSKNVSTNTRIICFAGTFMSHHAY